MKLTRLDLSCISAPMNTTASAPPAAATATTSENHWYSHTVQHTSARTGTSTKLLTTFTGAISSSTTAAPVASAAGPAAALTQAVSTHVQLCSSVGLHVVQDQVTQHLSTAQHTTACHDMSECEARHATAQCKDRKRQLPQHCIAPLSHGDGQYLIATHTTLRACQVPLSSAILPHCMMQLHKFRLVN